ncbi:MAG: Hpt domain-containing protein, partial [Rhodoferax sp.]|nr:Hpt domain-containing protein [Rhodoferax sp.]
VAAPAVTAALDDDDAEMREIFLEEAREVVQTGSQALAVLASTPADLGQQTALRRAFHTLKGSSRMVGLQEFGEAAWAMEQLANTWLAEQKPANHDLLAVCSQAMQQFGRWVEDIASSASTPWSAQPFRKSAEALRLHNQLVELGPPGVSGAAAVAPPPAVEPVAVTAPARPAADVAEPVSGGSGFEATQMFMPPDAAPEAARADFASTQMFDLAALSPAVAASQPTQLAEMANNLAERSDVKADTPSQAASAPPVPVPDAAVDLGDFDFGDLAAVGASAADAAASAEAAEMADAGVTLAPPADEATPALEAFAQPVEPLLESVDDQMRVIGSLRIGIPLYNVYLNEADEWSRRLLTELSEWEIEIDEPLRDSTVGLAHSLGGSSGTVGFHALADVARALEQAMQHVQLHQQGRPEHARVFNQAAEDIRRLLHQFAAGFLKEPDPAVLPALQAILETEFSVSEPASTLPGDLSGEAPIQEPDQAPLPPPRLGAQFEAGAAQLIVVHDDATDAVDALDADLFPIFEEEAADLFPQLGGALRQWAARPDNLGARNEALRVLHTLKGSARLAGAMRLGEMAHRLESAIEGLGSESFHASQVEPMLARFDGLQSLFDGLRKHAHQEPASTAPLTVTGAAVPVTAAGAPAAAVITDRRTGGRASAAVAPVRQLAGQTMRVSSQLLDRLLNQAGEVIITRSRLDGRLGQFRTSLKELGGNLDRLRQQLREIEVQSESQLQSRMAQAKDSAQDFDPLEFDRFTRVQELTRIMAESVSDVATVQRSLQRTMEGTEDDLIAQARQARDLQRDLLRTRMVEFEGISERLYGVVRQAAKDTGRQVKLDIVGGSMDLDRSVLERMAPAFEHLLRNAIAHGIEDAALRTAAGKSPVGTITITLQQEGNDVAVEFSDDGAGLDLRRVREKALANGLISADAVLNDGALANLIFEPGFSTADKVTELAGRGIGLDVVRSEVNALGGRIETSSIPGQGKRFKLVVPLTTAVTQVVMLRLGELAIGVPSNLVEVVKRVGADEVEQAYASGFFAHAGEQVPFYWAGSLLQASGQSAEPKSRHLPVVVFRSAGRRVATHVNEVLGNQEVVVKNLGPQLSRVPGLTGMSVLASGAVVLIYNPVALATVYGAQALQLQEQARQATSAAGAAAAAPTGSALAAVQTPLVLVVDDSITVRRVTQRLLKREGYRVVLAADGLQAIERLQEELPSVVLSDIEMPRMDGFDLARNIRGSERLRALPIIMITSRIAEKHREHARELGVDHYLGKPYAEEELLGLIRHYCALPANADGLA